MNGLGSQLPPVRLRPVRKAGLVTVLLALRIDGSTARAKARIGPGIR
jgi:hypothetical protein